MANETSIEAQNLTFELQKRKILENLSFSIPRGSFTIVVGENGAGKTTLLRLLMGLSKPTDGKILVGGNQPHLDPSESRQKIAYITESMKPAIDWSVSEYLEFNRFFYPTYNLEVEASLLKEFRVRPDSKFGHLSAGEIRRVLAIGVIAIGPDVLIIDEITAVLDIVGRAKFMKALQALQRQTQCTIIMATNILDDVDAYASHILLLHRGHLTSFTAKEELIATHEGSSLTKILAELIESAEASAS